MNNEMKLKLIIGGFGNDIVKKVLSSAMKRKHKNMLKKHQLVPISLVGENDNAIKEYWTGHTVLDNVFLLSKSDSEKYLDWRFSVYPRFREYSMMDACHDGEVVLDYGCGPGNDTCFLASNNKVKMIIGMDISPIALSLNQYRLGLHGVSNEYAKLMQIDENAERLPFEDGSIDFINCQGVLMHTTNPEQLIKEFYRVLRKSDNISASIMVYNRESIWYHLYAAWYLRFYDTSYISGLGLSAEEVNQMDVDEIMTKSTDGLHCPKADCYNPEDFIKMCENEGFEVNYKGGYPNALEPDMAKKFIQKALNDERLEEIHKTFLRDVEFDMEGYPVYRGMSCCIGGTYILRKK